MQETIEDLIESGQRLRVVADWLERPIEGLINEHMFRLRPDTCFLEADDGEVYALDLTDPSLHVMIVEPR